MKTFKDFLGPEATKQQDAAEIARQKKHLGDKAKEYYDQGAREGGHGAAIAKGITFDLAKKNIKEDDESISEDLRKWFKQKWVRMDTKGNIKGHCARDPGEGKPKCLPQARAQALGKEGRASAAQRKRREDPNPERHGAPINVRTESAAAAIAAATAISKKKSGNYDSEGFRKTPYKNPDAPNVKSNAERKKEMDEACWTGYTAKGMKKKGNRMVPNCVPEEVEQIDEKNVPTSPEKWARAKAAAKSKFAVYPSAYANGWASKKYKSMGGGWKATSEEVVNEDGEGGGGFAPAATNVVGGGAIAGSGGTGGEPGVSKKRNPVMSFFKRKKPKM